MRKKTKVCALLTTAVLLTAALFGMVWTASAAEDALKAAGSLIENGDFEIYEAGGSDSSFGQDNAGGTIMEESGNKYVKRTGGGWLRYRIWGAGSMLGKTYYISADMKSADATGSAQFLFNLKFAFNTAGTDWESGGVVQDIYAGDLRQGSMADWTHFASYFRVEADFEAQTVTVFAGDTPETMTERVTKELSGTASLLGYADVTVGTGSGAAGDWFVDNMTCFEVYDAVVTAEGTDAYGMPLDSAVLELTDAFGRKSTARPAVFGNEYRLANLYGKNTVKVTVGGVDKTCELTAAAPGASVDFGATGLSPSGNAVANGDFETSEVGATVGMWSDTGVIAEETDGNRYVQKASGGGLRTRVWETNYMMGRVYRYSVDVKTADAAAAEKTFLLGFGLGYRAAATDPNTPVTTKDGIWIAEASASAEWTTLSVYFRIDADYAAHKVTVFGGTDPAALTEKETFDLTSEEDDCHYIDFLVTANNWAPEYQIDNVFVKELTGRTYTETVSLLGDLFENVGNAESFALTDSVKDNYLSAGNLHFIGAQAVVNTQSASGSKSVMTAASLTSFRLRIPNTVKLGKEYRFEAKLMQEAYNSVSSFWFAQAGDLYVVKEDQAWQKLRLDRGVWKDYAFTFSIRDNEGTLEFFFNGKKLCNVHDAEVDQAKLTAYFDIFVQLAAAAPVYLDDVHMYEVFDGTVAVLDGADLPYADEEVTLKVTDALGVVTTLPATAYDRTTGSFALGGQYSVVTVEAFVDGASQGVKTLSKANAAATFSAPYTGTVTVVDGDGNAIGGAKLTKLSGEAGTISQEGNVFTIPGMAGEVTFLVEGPVCIDQQVTLTRDEKTKTVTLVVRETTKSPADYTDELTGVRGFEKAQQNGTAGVKDGTIAMFQNGSNPSVSLTDKVSHWGSKSVSVTTTGDRFVFRLINNTQIKDGTPYTAVVWARAKSGTVKLQPTVVVNYHNVGDEALANGWSGVNNSGNLKLGEEVTLTANAWTRIEIPLFFEVKDGKIYVDAVKKEGDAWVPCREEIFTADKTVHSVWMADLSLHYLSTTGDNTYYLDDFALFERFDSAVTVIGADGPVTEGVTFDVKDYTGAALTPAPKTEDGKFLFTGLFGVVKLTATAGGTTFQTASMNLSYPNVVVGEPYTATAKVSDQFGTAVKKDDVLAIFAMDGATRIDGVYDEDTDSWSFPDAMGDLEVYAYVKGSEQHKSYPASRTDRDITYYTSRVPDASLGLAGNQARQGNVETLDQLRQWQSTMAAYPGVTDGAGEGMWCSFGGVVSLSDEAAVGSKSLRITRNPDKLAELDETYSNYWQTVSAEEKAKYGNNRVAYRAGNAYGLDGTKYVMTSYVKAPSGQSVTFQYDFLWGINLCNNAGMNVWCSPVMTVGGDFWSKLVVEFSLETVPDDAIPAGTYEYDRYKLVMTVKISLNGKTLTDGSFEYGYNEYKDGTPSNLFYKNGEVSLTYFTEAEAEAGNYHDGIAGAEGGRSFGSVARFEPSFMVTNTSVGEHLLVDGTTLVAAYDAAVKVQNPDTTTKTDVAWFKVVDMYDNVLWIDAQQVFDAANGVYTLRGLAGGCTVEALDAEKKPYAGVRSGTVSGDKTNLTLEPEYTATVTLKDGGGNGVKGMDVYVTLDTGAKVFFEDNGDGTYTASGLTGTRIVTIRNKSTAETRYNFPSGKTVTSKNNAITVTGSVVEEGGETPVEPPVDNGGGCNCSKGEGSAMLAVLLLAGAAAVCKKLF